MFPAGPCEALTLITSLQPALFISKEVSEAASSMEQYLFTGKRGHHHCRSGGIQLQGPLSIHSELGQGCLEQGPYLIANPLALCESCSQILSLNSILSSAGEGPLWKLPEDELAH